MKFKLHSIAWLLIIPLGIVSFIYSNANFRLNFLALQVAHSSSQIENFFSALSIPNSSESTFFICHSNWLLLKNLDRESPISHNLVDFLECSYSFSDMIRTLAPQNEKLALRAMSLYPDRSGPLYWLAESRGGYTNPQNLDIFEKVIAQHEDEGLAECYLGYLYEKSGNTQMALDAFIICCNNDDLGNHGCYNAGRQYEKLFLYEEALRVYRNSRLNAAKESVKRLEAELFPENLNP